MPHEIHWHKQRLALFRRLALHCFQDRSRKVKVSNSKCNSCLLLRELVRLLGSVRFWLLKQPLGLRCWSHLFLHESFHKLNTDLERKRTKRVWNSSIEKLKSWLSQIPWTKNLTILHASTTSMRIAALGRAWEITVLPQPKAPGTAAVPPKVTGKSASMTWATKLKDGVHHCRSISVNV